MLGGLFEIEIAHWPFRRLFLGFLESLFKLPRQHVLFLAFGFPGIAELIFAALRLVGQDARGIGEVDVGGCFGRRDVREDDSQLRIDGKPRLTAGTRNLNGRGLLSHRDIVLLPGRTGVLARSGRSRRAQPLLKPGAGRSSGRGAGLGSAAGAGEGGCGGVGRIFSGSGLFSMSRRSSVASRTSRSSSASAMRSSVARFDSRMPRAVS